MERGEVPGLIQKGANPPMFTHTVGTLSATRGREQKKGGRPGLPASLLSRYRESG